MNLQKKCDFINSQILNYLNETINITMTTKKFTVCMFFGDPVIFINTCIFTS